MNESALISSPTDSDNSLISIISNGETTLPYLYWSWGSSWTGEAWAAADALQLSYKLPEIAQELPVVSYHDDFTVQYQEGVSFAFMVVYDNGFNRLYHVATYDDIDYLSRLEELPAGTYYIAISVAARGDYIKSENRYEYSGYECVFKLVKQ